MTSVPVAESAFGLERNLSFQGVLRRNTAGDLLGSATDATANTEGAALLYNPIGNILICFVQLGSTGASGLCYMTSTDGGQTWSAATQVTNRRDVYPAAVINEATGDVHVVYGQRSFPTLNTTDTPPATSASNIWGRVMAWTGSAWTVGGESLIIVTTLGHGYGMVSLAVDSNGFMVLAFQDNVSGAEVFVETLTTSAPWDLTTFGSGQQLSGILLTSSVSAYVAVRRLPEINYWFALYEWNGTVRVLVSSSVLSGGSHTLSWTQIGTFFVAAGEQYAVAWNPTPLGAVFGQVAIVYTNAGNVFYRTCEPQSSTVSGPTQLNTNTGSYPAVAWISSYWYIVWMEQVSAGQNRLRLARSDSLTTIFELDVDPGADGWGWLRLPETLGGAKTLPIVWSDTLDPGVDGFNVYAGMVSIEIVITVQAFATAVESILSGPQVSDTGSGVESLSAGEQFTVTDTGHASETTGLSPLAFETATAVETFTFSVGPATENEFGTATESFEISASLLVNDHGHVVEVLDIGLHKAVSDVAAAAEFLNRLAGELEQAFAHETLGIGILVHETAVAADQVLAGPDVTDSAVAVDFPQIGVGVTDTGTAVETESSPGPLVLDTAIISETLNAGQISGGHTHYSILSISGQHFDSFTGIPGGWSARALAADDIGMRLYTYEDLDTDYTDIVFATQPLSLTTYTKLKRSIDGGKTFNSVGPQMMAYIDRAPDGSLWGVGNDGTQPASPAPPPYGQLDGQNDYGWAVTQRMVFHSTDRGVSWAKVFDDQQYGQFGRYPHYTNIAVDSGGRPLALGVARGAVTDQEIQIARHGGIDPSGWQTVLIPKALMTARSAATGALGARIGDSFLIAAGSGRYVFGGNFASNQILPGPDRVWTSDDYGSSWDLRFSDQLPDFGQAAPCDATYRGGKLYVVRNDGLNGSPGKRILYSADNGGTFSFLDEPVLPHGSAAFSAVAFDHKLNVAYVGAQDAAGPVWRMDQTPSGSWENVLFNLAQVTDDQQLRTSYGGIGILSGLILHFDVFVNDSGHATEFAGQERIAHDTAHAVETVVVSLSNGVSIKLYMHRGRVRLRLLGDIEQAVISNPEG